MPGEVRLDEPADGVLRLTLANPAKRGALDHAILDGVAAAVNGLEPDVRCLVVRGHEGQFSSGYDIGDIPDETFAEEAEKLVAHPFTSAIDALEACQVPTIAALTGHAIGGGLELTLACDFRIAADGIRLGMPPAKLGLVYSHTGLRRFLNVIGEARTRELFLLGRYVDPQTAERWGLVNRVVDPDLLDGEALDWAVELAANAPLSIRGNKRALRALLAAEGALAADTEAELIALREQCFRSADLLEGVRAFAERRPPRWQGR